MTAGAERVTAGAERADGRAGGADVVTVIVAHNSMDCLPRCLEAVSRAAVAVDARALVSDSGSSDDPGVLCRRLGVEFLPGPNQGMGAAFNRALSLEHVRSARFVLQLNPDVVLRDGGLDALIALADRRSRCGILAPRQIDQQGELICSIGVEPTPASYWRAAREIWGDWNLETEAYAHEQDVDWVMGACMLLRTEMLAAVGAFDEQFFLYSEEVDLCRRARDAGWSVRYLPAVTVVHPIAGRPVNEQRVKLEEWSRILYIRKWFSLPARWSMRLAVSVRWARATLKDFRRTNRRERGDAGLRLRASLRFDRRRYRAAAEAAAAELGAR